MSTLDTNPLLSIILPVFNIGHYLPPSLDSLLSQNYQNIEIIAVDDFSRDDSWKILKIYKKFDKRIKIYRNVKHYGKGVTLNRALSHAKGQCIAFMDGKDIVYKNKFAQQVKFLQQNPKAVAVGSQCTYIDSNNKRLGTSTFPQSFDAIYHKPLHTVSINFETIMINKMLLPKDLLSFNTSEKHMLYSDVLIKLLQYGQLLNLPTPLQYRRKETPTTTTSLKELVSLVRLWIKSVDTYDYRPSIRSFFSSALRLPRLSTQ